MTQRVNPSRANAIELRPVAESDLPILFDYQRDMEVSEMAGFPAPDRDAFMAHWTKILGNETVVAMTVVVNRCVAGNVGCWTKNGQRRVGYWIAKEHWGKGVATQMLSMFLRLVSDRPLHAHVAEHNSASIRVLEKCGFTLLPKAAGSLGKPADGIEKLIYVIDTTSAGAA
ncbi:MAG: GNAT family N-acetyltransferase [Pirellulaceae bacterium]|jgi:RimJ/RimL family protein N-acetyltransferase|nr:GNAT family N-acetyltransferase [Pirellulaceae bacterium]